MMRFERFKSDEEIIKWFEEELEKGNLVPAENQEDLKKLLQETAERTLQKRKIYFTLEVSSPEIQKEVLKLLKERFGEKLKIVKVETYV